MNFWVKKYKNESLNNLSGSIVFNHIDQLVQMIWDRDNIFHSSTGFESAGMIFCSSFANNDQEKFWKEEEGTRTFGRLWY